MDETPPPTPATPPVRRRSGLRVQVVLLAVAVLVSALGAAIWSRTVADDDSDADEVFILDTPGEFVDPSLTNPNVEREPFPDVMVATPDGERITLEPDGRPMVVNLWYTSCPPCARELNYFANVEQQYGERVRFVGVDPQDTPERMLEFAAQRGVDYELLLDDELELFDALGVISFPMTVFVSADGEIVAQEGEVSEAELLAAVQSLLA